MAKKNYEEMLVPYTAVIQEWVDANIPETGGIPAKKIGEALSDKIPLDAADITVGFRLLVASGAVTGIVGRRKIGYCRGEVTDKPAKPEKPENEETGKLLIDLGNSQRLAAIDSRNWALQVWNGFNWVSQAYWGNLDEAFRGLSRRILNKKLRSNTVSLDSLSELAVLVKEAEDKIIEELRRVQSG